VTPPAQRASPIRFALQAGAFTWIVLSMLVAVGVFAFSLPADEVRWNPYLAAIVGCYLAGLALPITFCAAICTSIAAGLWAIWRKRQRSGRLTQV
jgi:hypothetical protein